MPRPSARYAGARRACPRCCSACWRKRRPAARGVPPACGEGCGPQSPTLDDAKLILAITVAHQKGLQVYLQPGVGVITPAGWAFRGFIQPADLPAWWESYRAFLVHYAEMAQDCGVEMFGIGFELDSMMQYTEAWNQTIETPIKTGDDVTMKPAEEVIRLWYAR
ncbi:MAG: hypothetical protein FJ026_06595 [Chloroflexi bacterium]|nr:hypothetical protein [Chloroflexota bacterium]